MLLRLAALGALGYAGYKYLQKNGYLETGSGSSVGTGGFGRQQSTGSEPDLSDPHVAMPGGPLSSEAAVVHAGEPLPAA